VSAAIDPARPAGLRLAVKPRVRGLARWMPQKATWTLIEQVRSVLDEYSAYLPLTIRQIFYRLVGAYLFPKEEKAYARLCEKLNRARRAGIIAFDAIRDDSADITTTTGWSSAAELIAQWRRDGEGFRLDRQQGQRIRLLIIVEAAGMKPQIETTVSYWGIPVSASGGFDSLTAKHDLALALGQHEGITEVLHIGDLDPSGNHLFLSMAEDVAALIAHRHLAGTAKFTRLAVTPEHVTALGLTTAPRKATDDRAFDGETVQAEAIAPDVLPVLSPTQWKPASIATRWSARSHAKIASGRGLRTVWTGSIHHERSNTQPKRGDACDQAHFRFVARRRAGQPADHGVLDRC
jgi:hypothetical protein